MDILTVATGRAALPHRGKHSYTIVFFSNIGILPVAGIVLTLCDVEIDVHFESLAFNGNHQNAQFSNICCWAAVQTTKVVVFLVQKNPHAAIIQKAVCVHTRTVLIPFATATLTNKWSCCSVLSHFGSGNCCGEKYKTCCISISFAGFAAV